MMLEIDQEYKVSPENHTPNRFDPPESLHKIDCVEKIWHEMFGLGSLSAFPGRHAYLFHP
jgi:hypothetical protein